MEELQIHQRREESRGIFNKGSGQKLGPGGIKLSTDFANPTYPVQVWVYCGNCILYSRQNADWVKEGLYMKDLQECSVKFSTYECFFFFYKKFGDKKK